MTHRPCSRFLLFFSLLAALWGAATPGQADTLLERFKHRLLEQRLGRDETAQSELKLRVLRDVPYGADARQTMDVYLPEAPASNPAPVVFLVHGGAWRAGDKRNSHVVDNKAQRWVHKGLVLISVNNRLLPEADPLDQVRDVAKALASAQHHARAWGADPGQFVLMGHSAGAHLVGLLSASATLGPQAGAQAWLGSVLLDSAALDVPGVMHKRHLKLYDPAFGTDPEFWRAVSPVHQLHARAKPMLAVCSSRRAEACEQAQSFARQATALGVRVQVSAQDLSHGEINKNLGLEGSYTDTVEAFMMTLSPSLYGRLR
jgi:acetyl esterase/lipase